MRSYLILKEKAQAFAEDQTIQGLLAEAQQASAEFPSYAGGYSRQAAEALREHSFDRGQLAARGLAYEKIDQLLTDLLLGVR